MAKEETSKPKDEFIDYTKTSASQMKREKLEREKLEAAKKKDK